MGTVQPDYQGALGRLLQLKSIAQRHSGSLLSLVSTSAMLNATNFGVTAINVIGLPLRIYAAYVVAQSIVILASALADGGMAASAGIIASNSGGDSGLVNGVKRAATRYAIVLALATLIMIVVLSAVFAQFDHRRSVILPIAMVAVCGVIGVVQARQMLCAALIYSGGQFRTYSSAVLLPAVLRLGGLIVLVTMLKEVTLPALLANDLLSMAAGWLHSAVSLRRLNARAAHRGQAAPRLTAESRRLLRSGFLPIFLDTLGQQAVVIAGGAFASELAMGAFGVFVRSVQVSKVVLDPSLAFGARRLRLCLPESRRRLEWLFVTSIVGVYSVMAACLFLAYLAASKIFHHYALGHGAEFLVFLSANVLNFLFLALDNLLMSRGSGDHRLVATTLAVLTSLLFVSLFRPATLWALVVSQCVLMLPRAAYCLWVVTSGRMNSPKWDVMAVEAVKMVAVPGSASK